MSRYYPPEEIKAMPDREKNKVFCRVYKRPPHSKELDNMRKNGTVVEIKFVLSQKYWKDTATPNKVSKFNTLLTPII
jgi:hypothetical protein